VGGVAGFEPVKNSIVVARSYHYTKGPLPDGLAFTGDSYNDEYIQDPAYYET